jgi:hypothetical protein
VSADGMAVILAAQAVINACSFSSVYDFDSG